jgi:hypothetical protein
MMGHGNRLSVIESGHHRVSTWHCPAFAPPTFRFSRLTGGLLRRNFRLPLARFEASRPLLAPLL